jgi:hypothetical protein
VKVNAGNDVPKTRELSGEFIQVGTGMNDLLDATASALQPASPVRGPPELRRARSEKPTEAKNGSDGGKVPQRCTRMRVCHARITDERSLYR